MRYPASEKLEIIRLVEKSYLPVRRTLGKLALQLHFPFEVFEMCASGFGLVSAAPQ